jgi:hypothetical protein
LPSENGEDGEPVTDGGIDTETLQLVADSGPAYIQADTPMVDIEIGASDAALRGLLDDLISYFECGDFSFEGDWYDQNPDWFEQSDGGDDQ